jgi:hypothetical protein
MVTLPLLLRVRNESLLSLFSFFLSLFSFFLVGVTMGTVAVSAVDRSASTVDISASTVDAALIARFSFASATATHATAPIVPFSFAFAAAITAGIVAIAVVNTVAFIVFDTNIPFSFAFAFAAAIVVIAVVDAMCAGDVTIVIVAVADLALVAFFALVTISHVPNAFLLAVSFDFLLAADIADPLLHLCYPCGPFSSSLLGRPFWQGK